MEKKQTMRSGSEKAGNLKLVFAFVGHVLG